MKAKIFWKILPLLLIALSLVLVCLLDHTSSLLADPLTTPDAYLASMPYWTMRLFGKDVVLIQPSSTLFVYLLGLVLIALGIYLLVRNNAQESRYDFGLGYLIWGISAILAGTSYQAFGYELKYAGREYGLFTSVFELLYMMTTAEAILYLLAGTSYFACPKKFQTGLRIAALAYGFLYAIVFFIGIAVPVKLLVTYEFFVAFFALPCLTMVGLTIYRFAKEKDLLSRNLLISWSIFALANLLYFAYYWSGLADSLYHNSGLWFNANDLLHLVMICWGAATFFLLKEPLQDQAMEGEINGRN
jgi:hypothetical protein